MRSGETINWSNEPSSRSRATAWDVTAIAEIAPRTAFAVAAASPAAATAKAVTTARPITAAHEGIKTAFFAETVPLVAPPAATTSIETHKTQITFASPRYPCLDHADETREATVNHTEIRSAPSSASADIDQFIHKCEWNHRTPISAGKRDISARIWD